MMRRLVIVLFLLGMVAAAAPAWAQTATFTPSPTATRTPIPTGTLLGFPALPTALPTLAATITPVWFTPTPPTFGDRFIPPTAPVELTIPEVGQQNGFGALGRNNTWRFAFYITYTGVSFWNWTYTNADELIDAVRYGLAIGFVILQIIGKLNKYQGKSGKTWAATLGGQIERQVNRNRPVTPKSGNPFQDTKPPKSVIVLPLIALTMLSPYQQVCNAAGSCEGIPWQLPQMPALLSPTPFPTGQITALYTPTPTGTLPTPTATSTAPAPTATPGLDMTLLNGQLGTLQAVAQVTPLSVAGELAPQNVSGNVSRVYGLFLGMKDIHFGPFTPLFQAAIFFLFTYMGQHFFFLIYPALSAMIGLLRRAVEFVLDLLPF